MTRSGADLRVVESRDDAEPFPVRLRNRRKERGLTQAELGDQLGCSQQRVGAWERKWERPTAQHHHALAGFLGLRSQAELIDLLELMPAQRATIAATRTVGGEPVSARRAEAMLDQLANALVERGEAMSADEHRSHLLLIEFYRGVVAREP